MNETVGRIEFDFPNEMEVFEEENEMQLLLFELYEKQKAILKHLEKQDRVYYEDGELKNRRCQNCIHHATIDYPVCFTFISCPDFKRI